MFQQKLFLQRHSYHLSQCFAKSAKRDQLQYVLNSTPMTLPVTVNMEMQINAIPHQVLEWLYPTKSYTLLSLCLGTVKVFLLHPNHVLMKKFPVMCWWFQLHCIMKIVPHSNAFRRSKNNMKKMLTLYHPKLIW